MEPRRWIPYAATRRRFASACCISDLPVQDKSVEQPWYAVRANELRAVVTAPCQSALFVDFGGYASRRHGSRPAGIEREVGDNLSYLAFFSSPPPRARPR